MNSIKSLFEAENIVYSKGSNLKPLEAYDGYFIRADLTVNTPAAKSFASATDIDTSTEIITEIAHGFLTGLVGQMTTDGSLPTGLSLATNYYIIKVDDDSYKLASSLANSLSRTAINITAAGSGNQTFTPKALENAKIKLQSSDIENPSQDSHWDDIPSSVADISETSVQTWNVSDAYYHKVRYYVTLDSGQIDISANFNGKGY